MSELVVLQAEAYKLHADLSQHFIDCRRCRKAAKGDQQLESMCKHGRWRMRNLALARAALKGIQDRHSRDSTT